MLTQLREMLISDGGWLGDVTRQVVIRNIRNGEAHETLVWDGVRERFIAEGLEVLDITVAIAATWAAAFARGCEAAIACFRALEIEHKPGPPQEHDAGRLTPWRRAEALFGTNGIRVIRADFNSKIARIACLSIEQHNINPCFQALVAIHRLLPHVQRFEVLIPEQKEPTISVSREALERTFRVWETAIEYLTVMPFSAFLPANLDARISSEGLPRAARSVAWIAVDDLLDALDGSATEWRAKDLELFSKRVALVGLATVQCMKAVPAEAQVRLRAVQHAANDMVSWLRSVSTPIYYRDVAVAEPVAKFRHWWEVWGPVERLPTVVTSTNRSMGQDHYPALKNEAHDLRWQTI